VSKFISFLKKAYYWRKLEKIDINKRTCALGFQATFSSLFLWPRKLKETIFIPLTTPSDTYFRDRRISWRKMSSVWITKSESILSKGGVLSFLIHPADYEEAPFALESLLKYVSQQNIRFMDSDAFQNLASERLRLESG